LQRFFEDRKNAHFPLHEIVLHPEAHHH